VSVLSRKEVEAGKLKGFPATLPVVAEEPRIEATIEETPEEKPRKKKPKGDDPWFTLQHPDCTDSFKPDCMIEVAGEQVKIESGRVETQVEAVRVELCRQGWRWMNEVF
jgi:hypothetical protein